MYQVSKSAQKTLLKIEKNFQQAFANAGLSMTEDMQAQMNARKEATDLLVAQSDTDISDETTEAARNNVSSKYEPGARYDSAADFGMSIEEYCTGRNGNYTLFDTGESFDKTSTFNYNDIKDGDYSDDRIYGQKVREGFQSFRRRNAQNAGRDGRNSIKTPEIYLNKGDYSGVASQELLKSRIVKELTKDSMAIDADGIPIIGYHGTSSEFFEFKDNEKHNFDGSIGHHFSLNPVVSEMYAEYASYADDSKKKLIYPSIFSVHSTVEIYPSDLNQNFDVANKLLRDILTLNEYVEDANFYDDLFYFLKNRGYSEKIIDSVVNAYKKYGTAIDSVMYRDAQWDSEDGPINDQLVVFDGSNILPATQSFWDAFKKEFEENYTDSGAFSLPGKDTRYSTGVSFDDVTPIEDSPYADPMYYKSARVIESINQSKFDAASLIKMLQGKNVKADEIKWLGLEQWLADKKSVSKGELLQFIHDNQLVMTETTRGQVDYKESSVFRRVAAYKPVESALEIIGDTLDFP